MNGGQIALFIAGTVGLLAGGYIAFFKGDVIGVVFMGMATIMFSLAAAQGAKAKKDIGDAG